MGGCSGNTFYSYNFELNKKNDIICYIISYNDNDDDNNNCIYGQEIKLFEKIKSENYIKNLISLTNDIFRHIYRLDNNKIWTLISEFQFIFRKIFECFLSENEVSTNLKVIELFIKKEPKIKNFDYLLKLIELLKLIYSKKKELKEKLRDFISNIKYVLEKAKILGEDDINLFGNYLNKIFIQDYELEKDIIINEKKQPIENQKKKNIDDINEQLKKVNKDNLIFDQNLKEKSEEKFIEEEKDLNNNLNNEKEGNIFFKENFEEKQENKVSKENFNIKKGDNLIIEEIHEEKEKEIFAEELEKKSLTSFKSFSNYSKNSQNQIMKMEKKIKELEEQNKVNNKKKRFLKLKFFYNKEFKYSLDINVNEEDRFSTIIDELYEKYPEIEEEGIKRFLFNSERIKRNELIKDIKFDDCSKIEIEY